MKPMRRSFEPTAIELVEESVHLLRGAPASTLVTYYAGAVPCALGVLFFWAYTTWFLPAGTDLAWGALGLVGVFAGLKVAQAEFCARLLAQRLGAEPPVWPWRRRLRVAAAQLRLQPWVLLVAPAALLLTVPLAWLCAYAQTLVVLGDEEHLHDEAVAQARLWPGQNHAGLLLIAAVGLAAWINLGATFFAVPWLANKLLGLENIFGFSGWAYLNTTFVASVTVLTWLAVDPLVKAFYTLRVFHGRARRTGDDLRVELQLAGRPLAGAGARVRLALLGVACLLVGQGEAEGASPAAEADRAAEGPPPVTAPTAVQPARLDRTIDEVLAAPEFRWRLRRPAEPENPAEGPVKRFVRQGFELLKEMAQAAGRWIKRVVDWVERQFTGDRAGQSAAPSGGGGLALETLRLLLYAFVAAAAALICWVIWLVVRQARRSAIPVLTAQAVAAAAPDLRDENVGAAQLPAEGWLALAREQMERGAWRLALRALYLATLARLAAEGLVSLARFKTNLDYEREVRRRALSRHEVVARFAERRREFESVWYGRAESGEARVRAWLAELEHRSTP